VGDLAAALGDAQAQLVVSFFVHLLKLPSIDFHQVSVAVAIVHQQSDDPAAATLFVTAAAAEFVRGLLLNVGR
jgi:hypothetical protein